MKTMKIKFVIAAVLVLGLAASHARECKGVDIRIGPVGICIGKSN